MFEAKIDKICYIVGAGECDVLDFKRKKDDLIIAVDGGFRYLEKESITPDLLVGDMDSLGTEVIFENKLRLEKEKDYTDTFKAVEIAISKGYKSFIFYGASGGRLSHTIANLQLLDYLANNGCQGYIISQKSQITVIRDSAITLQKRKGYVSIFALNGEAKGVTLNGFKYPLTDYDMTGLYPIGISNEVVGEKAVIDVKKGSVLVIIEDFKE